MSLFLTIIAFITIGFWLVKITKTGQSQKQKTLYKNLGISLNPFLTKEFSLGEKSYHLEKGIFYETIDTKKKVIVEDHYTLDQLYHLYLDLPETEKTFKKTSSSTKKSTSSKNFSLFGSPQKTDNELIPGTMEWYDLQKRIDTLSDETGSYSWNDPDNKW